MNWSRRAFWAGLAAVPCLHLFPGCGFSVPVGTPGFNAGQPPLSTAIFCDVEADRRCASSDDLMMGVDVAKPFEQGFWIGRSSPIGLDFSPAALAACNGGAQAIAYRDAFPNGTPVCVNPSVFPAPHVSVNAACQSWCYAQGWTDPNGDKYSCRDIAWVSNGVPDVGSPGGVGFPGACTDAGSLRPDFQDARKIRPMVPVVWTAAVGVGVSGSDLVKTSTMGWGSADPSFESGAVSQQNLAGGDGGALTTVAETNSLRIFGLGNGGSCRTFEDVEFGLLLTQAGTLLVVESGTVRGNFGAYATGDTLEVGVSGGVVVYKRNNALFYTSSVAPPYPLQMEAAFNFTGATLRTARVSF